MSDSIDSGMKGIERLPSGRYRVRVQRAKRALKIPICATLDEARALREAILQQVDRGEMIPVDGLSVRAWGPTWLREYRAGNRNYTTDRSRFSHLASAEFATKPMLAVEPRDVVEWLGALKKKMTAHRFGKRPAKPLGWATRRHCLNLARAMFSDALTLGLVPANPALGLHVKKTDEDRSCDQLPEEWPLTPEQQAVLHDALGDDPERLIVAFAIGTGLRQGEQWNLHVADVHTEGPAPHVHVRFGSQGKTPKNRKTRKVPLFGLGLEAARAWLELLPKYAPHNPHRLMFPRPARAGGVDGKRGTKGGSRRGKGKVPACWSLAKSALERPVWWHLLRHTCATSLICGWWGRKWSLEEVGKLLGHSSSRVTEVYAHLLDSALAEVAAESELAWSQLPRVCHAAGQESAISSGAPRKIRTSDPRLRRPTDEADSPRETVSRGDPVASARRLLELLACGADDADSWEEAKRLASAVRADRGLRLVEQIEAAGPFALHRAVDLAELILESERARTLEAGAA